jgi:hypothetical protein
LLEKKSSTSKKIKIGLMDKKMILSNYRVKPITGKYFCIRW